MAERMHVLNAQHQIDHRHYDGQPLAHWVRERNQSLPPPADKPAKAQKVKKTTNVLKHPELSSPGVRAKMEGRKELRPGPNGQMYWQWSLEVVAEVQQRLRAGQRQADIERNLDMSSVSVSRIRRDMLAGGEVLPDSKSAQPKPIKARTRAAKASSFNGSDGDELLKHVARGAMTAGHLLIARAPVAEAGFASPLTCATPLACATPAPAPSPIPMPAPAPSPLGPWGADREPVRACHVLDWRDRMQAWAYEDHYQKPRPKRRTKIRVLAHDDGTHRAMTATEINPKRDRPPQLIAETVDPFTG